MVVTRFFLFRFIDEDDSVEGAYPPRHEDDLLGFVRRYGDGLDDFRGLERHFELRECAVDESELVKGCLLMYRGKEVVPAAVEVR